MRSVFLKSLTLFASSTYESWSGHYIQRIDTLQATATADSTLNWTAVGSVTPSSILSSADEGRLDRTTASDISANGSRGLSAAAAMVVTSLTLTEAETMVSLPPPSPFPSNTFTQNSSQPQGMKITLPLHPHDQVKRKLLTALFAMYLNNNYYLNFRYPHFRHAEQ